MKRTSPPQLRHWQANKYMYLFGKKLKILYFKCYKAKYRNMRVKERENLYFWLI